MDTDDVVRLLLLHRQRRNERLAQAVAQIAECYSSSFLQKRPKYTQDIPGSVFVHSILSGHPELSIEQFRMKVTFLTSLYSNCRHSVTSNQQEILGCEEMVAIFL